MSQRFLGRAPGIGIAAAEWLVTRDPMLVGADNQPVEIQPNPDSDISLPIHQIMLVVNGIHLLERMKLDELAAREVYEFAFVMQPLKIRGATGSTVAPARDLLNQLSTGEDGEKTATIRFSGVALDARWTSESDEPASGACGLAGSSPSAAVRRTALSGRQRPTRGAGPCRAIRAG